LFTFGKLRDNYKKGEHKEEKPERLGARTAKGIAMRPPFSFGKRLGEKRLASQKKTKKKEKKGMRLIISS
jgi:hypothetical protein